MGAPPGKGPGSGLRKKHSPVTDKSGLRKQFPSLRPFPVRNASLWHAESTRARKKVSRQWRVVYLSSSNGFRTFQSRTHAYFRLEPHSTTLGRNETQRRIAGSRGAFSRPETESKRKAS